MALRLFWQILSFFIMMTMGFALVKTHLLRSEDSKILSVLMFYVIIPCTIIRSYQIDLTNEVKAGFGLAVLAAFLIHFALIVIVTVLKRIFSLDGVEVASITYSNAGNLVIPLLTALMGDEYVIYASAYICVQLLFIWTHGRIAISGQKGIGLREVLLNWDLMAAFLGAFLMFAKIRLPGPVQDAMGGIASTIGPVSLIMIGMLLAGVDPGKLFREKKLYLTVFLKMLPVPLLVMAVLKVLNLAALIPDGKTIIYISFLAVMTPTAAMVTQIAQIFDNRPEYASAINTLTTLTCIVTMPLLTALYMRWM